MTLPTPKELGQKLENSLAKVIGQYSRNETRFNSLSKEEINFLIQLKQSLLYSKMYQEGEYLKLFDDITNKYFKLITKGVKRSQKNPLDIKNNYNEIKDKELVINLSIKDLEERLN